MNIKEAKQEIIHTIKAYTARNAAGAYAIPPRHQRPVLLIGPPGIGKTAVMQQAAEECGVGFVSYTMTHHTRQSAVGLPFIRTRSFDGREYSVTEYTMSEIIASVFQCMEESGKKEGLLFLDEINCVSETLAPTMLQFLQNKTFGSHRLPDGWILAAAGNPPEYNKSVREFDIATLDRLKYIPVEADYGAWRAYALEAGIHGAIPAYLDTHRDRFYLMRQTYTEKSFATARGWEDLSCLLLQYEALRLPVTAALIGQYLHAEELARDFAGYYQFFTARKEALPVAAIFSGEESAVLSCRSLLREAPFDEKLLLVHLGLSFLGDRLRSWEQKQRQLRLFDDALERLIRHQKQQKLPSLAKAAGPFLVKEEEILAVRQQHGLSSDEEIQSTRQVLYELRDLAYRCRSVSSVSDVPDSRQNFTSVSGCASSAFASDIPDSRQNFASVSGCIPPASASDGSVSIRVSVPPDLAFFEAEKKARQDSLLADAKELLLMLERFSLLLEESGGPELTLFVSSFSQNKHAVSFLKKYPSALFERLKERLRFESREEELRQALAAAFSV